MGMAGGLIRWAWWSSDCPTKLMDGLFNYLLELGRKDRKYLWEKSSCHSWELNAYLLLVKQVH